jgi:HAD superfamily hydrolase (TIGR01509 family)
MTLKAILFDFNGVIINDEPVHQSLIEEILLGENLFPSVEDFQQICLGRSDRVCLRDLLMKRGRVVSEQYLDQLIDKKARAYRQKLQELPELPIYPEVKSCLEKIKEKGLAIALVTGALRTEVELVLEKAEIRDYFQVVVTGDAIKTSKPEPDGYLLAVEHLNRLDQNLQLQPSDCVAIEDSPAGIEAAKRAGMQVVGIANTYPLHFMQRLANWAIDYLSELELTRIEDFFGATTDSE